MTSSELHGLHPSWRRGGANAIGKIDVQAAESRRESHFTCRIFGLQAIETQDTCLIASGLVRNSQEEDCERRELAANKPRFGQLITHECAFAGDTYRSVCALLNPYKWWSGMRGT